jgi:hypothetical protein
VRSRGDWNRPATATGSRPLVAARRAVRNVATWQAMHWVLVVSWSAGFWIAARASSDAVR